MKIRTMIAEGMTLREIQERVSAIVVRLVLKEESQKGRGAATRAAARLGVHRNTIDRTSQLIVKSAKLVCSNQTQELDSGERN